MGDCFARVSWIRVFLLCVFMLPIVIACLCWVMPRSDIVAGGPQLAPDANARASLDWLEHDLSGLVPRSSGRQRFILKNGAGNGEEPCGLDEIAFTARISNRGAPQVLQVCYHLEAENDPEGEDTHQGGLLYRLVRRINTCPDDGSTQGRLIEESDLCHYVVSFNIQVFCDANSNVGLPAKFYELDDSSTPYRNTSTTIWDSQEPYPFGFGSDWTCAPVAEPSMPGSIRATLRIAGLGKQRDRVLTREISLPAK